MRKGFLGLALVALSGIVVASALAGSGWQRGRGGHMMGPGYGMGPNMTGPGAYGGGQGYCWNLPYGAELSSEQRAKLDQLRRKYLEETRPLREQLFRRQQELWGLYNQPDHDPKAVSALQKEIFELRQKLHEKGLAFRNEASQIAPNFRGPYGRGGGWHHMGPLGWGNHMMGPYAGGPGLGY